ncbi:hypothetical protein [Sinorhizobium meliloti]|uniref:hypothetical protein n=1 Tax=Rhizobium meliloti TaxID=382 RepID=UPI000FDA0E14|nr:hypothetical protein [Sinorhizobium meliloti]MDW9928079.1 hypothetical protein [Sinorhizobium meliloti]MDX0966386.1 hypothetical protein [Sinorhizobium medicae]RVI41813.1 hypothetical protein CN195_30935 [Sinorhizobium meliloti]
MEKSTSGQSARHYEEAGRRDSEEDRGLQMASEVVKLMAIRLPFVPSEPREFVKADISSREAARIRAASHKA